MLSRASLARPRQTQGRAGECDLPFPPWNSQPLALSHQPMTIGGGRHPVPIPIRQSQIKRKQAEMLPRGYAPKILERLSVMINSTAGSLVLVCASIWLWLSGSLPPSPFSLLVCPSDDGKACCRRGD